MKTKKYIIAGVTIIILVVFALSFLNLPVKANYAKPAKWENLAELPDESREFIEKYRDSMTDIASYFLENEDKRHTEIELDKSGNLVNSENVELGDMEKVVSDLLHNSQYQLSINSDEWKVSFEIAEANQSGSVLGYQIIQFNFDEDVPKTSDVIPGYIKLAPHWSFHFFAPV